MIEVILEDNPITVTVEGETSSVVEVVQPSVSVEISGGVGPQGPQGIPGVGVPPNGLAGYKLAKVTDGSFDTAWVADNVPVGVDKEIQFNDGGVLGGDSNFKWDKNTKSVKLGIAGDEVFPNNPLVMVGSVDDYYQVVIHNESETPGASADIVATADNGDDESFYVDMGINSSVWEDLPGDITKANDSYVWADGGDLHLIAATGGKKVVVSDGVTPFAEITSSGINLPEGASITNRPEVFYGTGAPPTASGLLDGALYYKYTL